MGWRADGAAARLSPSSRQATRRCSKRDWQRGGRRSSAATASGRAATRGSKHPRQQRRRGAELRSNRLRGGAAARGSKHPPAATAQSSAATALGRGRCAAQQTRAGSNGMRRVQPVQHRRRAGQQTALAASRARAGTVLMCATVATTPPRRVGRRGRQREPGRYAARTSPPEDLPAISGVRRFRFRHHPRRDPRGAPQGESRQARRRREGEKLPRLAYRDTRHGAPGQPDGRTLGITASRCAIEKKTGPA